MSEPLPVGRARSTALGAMQRRFAVARRRVREAEVTWFAVLVALALLCMALGQTFDDWWPFAAYVVPLMLAVNVLSLPRLAILDAVVAGCLVASFTGTELTRLRWTAAAVIVVVAGIVFVTSRGRSRLGLATGRGESMLIDLRDRLASQSQLPALPRGWHAEAMMRSAGGASFAGDFIVAATTHHGRMLEVVVVDVSGKGVNAGTRALQLSGAFGGLLGSLSREDFLPAANEYLLRQEWHEGFASTVHLALDLGSGAFELRSAGHPPAVQFHAGSGRWTVHWVEGPVLGIVGGAEYAVRTGTMSVGDMLLLYTDGLVETPQRDIMHGIDKLVGEAERLVPRGFDGGAERLVTSIDSESDDRAIVMLTRR
ncbi:MAG: PP2C family protein-serine/threonine phosphatase [Nocardioidaceae bacterium]